MPDGSLRISTKIDNSKIDKDIIELENKIKKLQRNNSKNSLEQNNLQNEINKYDELCLKADEYHYKIKQLNIEKEAIFKANPELAVSVDTPEYANIKNQITEMKQKYEETTQEIDKQAPKIEKIRLKLQDVKEQQVENNTKIAEYNRQLQESQKKQFDLNYSTEGMSKSINKGITKILRYGAALFSIRSIYGLLSNAMNSWLNGSNTGAKQLRSDIDYMKNAIGGALSPILKYIVDLLYQALGFAGALIKAFTGIDIFAGSVADYMSATTSSASQTNKELKKQLTSFDRINKLNDNSSSGSGATGGIMTPSQDLSEVMKKYEEITKEIKDNFEQIKDLAILIGLAIGTWKLTKVFGTTGLIIGILLIGAKLIKTSYDLEEDIMKQISKETGMEYENKNFLEKTELKFQMGLEILGLKENTNSITSMLEEEKNKVLSEMGKWISDIWTTLTDYGKKKVEETYNNVKKWVAKKISEIFSNIKNWAKEKTEYLVNSLKDFIFEGLCKIILKIADLVEKIPVIGNSIASAIRSGVESSKKDMTTTITTTTEGAIQDSSGAIKNKSSQAGTSYMKEMKDAIYKEKNNLANTIKNTNNEATNNASSSIETNGRQLGIKAMNGVKLGEKSQTNSLANTTSQVVNSANNSVNTSSASSIGKNIISGIRLGITGNSWSLYSSITTLGSNLLRTFKNAMGIHSPSREMASLAKFIPLGIAEGIDSTSDKAISSMKSLVTDIEDTASNMDVQYNIPKIPRNAVSYVPRQAISTNEIQRTIVGEDNNLLNKLLSNIQKGSNGNKTITIPLIIDGEEFFRKTIQLNENYNLATNGGGL